MRKFIDLTDKRFGKLLVLSFSHQDSRHKSYWNCLCDCGNECLKRTDSLNGGTQSCGCLRMEILSLDFGEGAFNILHKHYINSAKIRNISFELSKEYFRELTQKNCRYCNDKPSQVFKTTSNNGDFIYNGIDRVDNSKGYTIENCVPCCKVCNYAKRNMSEEEFLNWVKRVYNNIVVEDVSDSWSKK